MPVSAYYNEIDEFATNWLCELIAAKLIPDGAVDTRSIWDVAPEDLRGFTQHHFFAGIGGWAYALRLAGWSDNQPVWTGSCPCQPFSAAGQRKGFADERHLWPAWFHLISQCKPSIVFGEQVANALDWLDLVQSDLEATEYAFAAFDLCAAGVGAPHLRQRLWFVAYSYLQRCQGATTRNPLSHTQRLMASSKSIGYSVLGPVSPSLQPPWAPGPSGVWTIPSAVDGLSTPLAGRNGYGNAIVPQVAAEVIKAYMSLRR